MDPQAILARLVAGEHLAGAETRALCETLLDAALEPALAGALLSALATKGETVDDVVGAAEALRARMTHVRTPAGVEPIDTCGTGGDGKPTFNVSTAVAIVAAGAGATVAKHGNRSNARPSGSAEVLAALGIDIHADASAVERCLTTHRITFLYAPRWHPAMKRLAPVRRSLSVRTIFNLVGPLVNPAGVTRQVVGVSRVDLVDLVSAALRQLGATRALVVHGLEGLCDLSIAGPSRVARWDGQSVTTEEVDVRVIGATPGRLDDLYVRSPQESAALIERVLAGAPGPAREAVVFNAAAALWVAGRARDWEEGAAQARLALDSGAARAILAAWRHDLPVESSAANAVSDDKS